jgi:pimeloyl-ACP methyl ester carboxylesterase
MFDHIQETKLDTPYESKFVDANGIRLHYLDWGGNGPVLLFLAGFGCSAYIFSEFASLFTGHFQVIGLTRRGHGDSDYPETGYDVDTLAEDLLQFMDALQIDRAILVGHSMANLELCHFNALHPQRVLKLVFLEASYDCTSPAYKAMLEKSPLRNIAIPGANDDHYTIEDYVAAVKRAFPSLAAIWGEVMDEEVLHSIKTDPEGKIVDRMSDSIGSAIRVAINSYQPEVSKIQAPVLSIFAINDGSYYLSPDYMTAEQQAQVLEFYEKVRPAFQKECIIQFRGDLPHARVIIIPKGHHYCFFTNKELVFEEMSRFLAA